MSEQPNNEDGDRLEAYDFVVTVLKEHEKNLDRLINELDKVAENLSPSPEVTKKIEGIEQRLMSLQSEVKRARTLAKGSSTPEESHVPNSQGSLVNVKCKQWEDFKVLSKNAESASFVLKESEKTFQVSALKDGRFLTYNGEFPHGSKLFKCWLAHELNLAEDNVVESY